MLGTSLTNGSKDLVARLSSLNVDEHHHQDVIREVVDGGTEEELFSRIEALFAEVSMLLNLIYGKFHFYNPKTVKASS